MTDQPPPAPSRRDHETPAAGRHGPPPMTDAQLRAYRDAWLDEMWAPVRGFHPAQEPTKKAKKGRKKRSPVSPVESPSLSTGCAETGSTEMPGSAA